MQPACLAASSADFQTAYRITILTRLAA